MAGMLSRFFYRTPNLRPDTPDHHMVNLHELERAFSQHEHMVSTLSTNRPADPFPGMHIFETDTLKIYAWTGSAWRQMGTLGAWDTYTPTLAQSTATNIAKNIEQAIYTQDAGRCYVIVGLVTTAGSGVTGEVSVTLPITPVSEYTIIGSGWFYDSTAPGVVYGLQPEIIPTLTAKARFKAPAGTGASYFGAAPSLAIGSGDIIRFGITYPVA